MDHYLDRNIKIIYCDKIEIMICYFCLKMSTVSVIWQPSTTLQVTSSLRMKSLKTSNRSQTKRLDSAVGLTWRTMETCRSTVVSGQYTCRQSDPWSGPATNRTEHHWDHKKSWECSMWMECCIDSIPPTAGLDWPLKQPYRCHSTPVTSSSPGLTSCQTGKLLPDTAIIC